MEFLEGQLAKIPKVCRRDFQPNPQSPQRHRQICWPTNQSSKAEHLKGFRKLYIAGLDEKSKELNCTDNTWLLKQENPY